MGRRRRRVRHLSKRIRQLLPGLQHSGRSMSNCVGNLQAPVSSSLHLQMDRRTTTRGTEMSHVSTGLDATSNHDHDHDHDHDNDNGHDSRLMHEYQLPENLRKYWAQRYRLFHRFDDGIQLDDEGWYSVTPEKIASHIAQRFEGLGVVVDLFSGPGGNCIQFALHGAYVVGIERSPETIRMARQNARVYGVEQYIDFINADVYQVLPKLGEMVNGIDGIFMSPPWGGPTYNDGKYDVSVFSEAVNGALKITENVSVLIPRNVTLENVAQTFGRCEVEKNFLGGKYKTQTLYFGSLIGGGRKMKMRTFAPKRGPSENLISNNAERPSKLKNKGLGKGADKEVDKENDAPTSGVCE